MIKTTLIVDAPSGNGCAECLTGNCNASRAQAAGQNRARHGTSRYDKVHSAAMTR